MPSLQMKVGSAYQVLLGRASKYFLTNVISLEQSRIEEPISLAEDSELPIFETLMDNRVTLRLCDTAGRRFYISE
jgi:hypothetical protein